MKITILPADSQQTASAAPRSVAPGMKAKTNENDTADLNRQRLQRILDDLTRTRRERQQRHHEQFHHPSGA